MANHITNDQKEEFISLYNDGVAVAEIARRMGWDGKYADRFANKLYISGDLERRECARHTPKTLERMEVIKVLWAKGIKQYEISTRLGISLRSTNRLIVQMKKEGLLPERKIHRENKYNPKAVVKVEAKRVVPSTLKEGETIKCTTRVARTCVYGGRSLESGLCRFSAVTDKCRTVGEDACPSTACTRYSKISKDNPRLSSV